MDDVILNDYYEEDNDIGYEVNGTLGILFLLIMGLIPLVLISVLLSRMYIDKYKLKTKINNILNNIGTENKYIEYEILVPEVCTICYENYQKNDSIYTLNCCHSYHYNCIEKLIIKDLENVKCPYCQQKYDY